MYFIKDIHSWLKQFLSELNRSSWLFADFHTSQQLEWKRGASHRHSLGRSDRRNLTKKGKHRFSLSEACSLLNSSQFCKVVQEGKINLFLQGRRLELKEFQYLSSQAGSLLSVGPELNNICHFAGRNPESQAGGASEVLGHYMNTQQDYSQ